MAVRIVAETILKPGYREALEPAFKKLIENTRAEAGNISYDLTETLDDPNHLFFIEQWESHEAIAAHFQMPHFLEYSSFVADKVVKRVAYKVQSIK